MLKTSTMKFFDQRGAFINGFMSPFMGQTVGSGAPL